MKKIMNQITKVVHVAYHDTDMAHCGSYIVLATKMPIDTEVTCGHCRRIFKLDSKVAGVKVKGKDILLNSMKALMRNHPHKSHTITARLKPKSLKALIHFMEYHSSAGSMSEAVNEIIPKYVRKLNSS